MRAGLGVAVLEPLTAHGAPLDGVVVRPLDTDIPFFFGVITPQSRPLCAPVRALVDALLHGRRATRDAALPLLRELHVQPAVLRGLIDRAVGLVERLVLQRYGLADSGIAFQRSADMRYRRQAYEINMRLPDRALTSADQAEIGEAFHQLHERMYGRRDTAGLIQFVTLSVTAVGNTRRLEHSPLAQGDGSAKTARKPPHQVYFRDHGMIECACYDRTLLLAADTVTGPALIEAADSTTVVPSAWTVRCDEVGNLIIKRKG